MPILVDTGFLFALANTKDKHHAISLESAQTIGDKFIIPDTVLPEICYLLKNYLGHNALCHFINQLQKGIIQVEALRITDLARIHEILTRYTDDGLDFVDASIISIAERLGVTRIMTIDHKHFREFHPLHCEAFELLP